jgi:hypothetical protein
VKRGGGTVSDKQWDGLHLIESTAAHHKKILERGAIGEIVKSPLILVSSILVAVGLGSVFSFVYPMVKIDFDLAFLFMLVGLLIVLAIRGMWQAIWHKKK